MKKVFCAKIASVFSENAAARATGFYWGSTVSYKGRTGGSCLEVAWDLEEVSIDNPWKGFMNIPANHR